MGAANGSALMHAANDEEQVVGQRQRTWGPKGQGLELSIPLHVIRSLFRSTSSLASG